MLHRTITVYAAPHKSQEVKPMLTRMLLNQPITETLQADLTPPGGLARILCPGVEFRKSVPI